MNNSNADDPPALALQGSQLSVSELRRSQVMRIAQAIGMIFVLLLLMSYLNIKLTPLIIAIAIFFVIGLILRITLCLCIRYNSSRSNSIYNANEVELESGRRSALRGHRSRHRHHHSRHNHQPPEGNVTGGDDDDDNDEDVPVVNPLSLRLSFVDRDFTDDDYEVLLALDRVSQIMDRMLGERPPRGATKSELSELPTHVYKTVTATKEESSDGDEKDESKESTAKLDKERNVCAICLEDFKDGDVVTTTPCFHQFHRDCINTWLTQKAVCPICKYELFKPHTEGN